MPDTWRRDATEAEDSGQPVAPASTTAPTRAHGGSHGSATSRRLRGGDERGRSMIRPFFLPNVAATEEEETGLERWSDGWEGRLAGVAMARRARLQQYGWWGRQLEV